MSRQDLLVQSVNEVTQENSHVKENPIELIKRVYDKFMNSQIQSFPTYCHDVYIANKLQDEQDRQIGIKGRFTDSYGWSPDRTFRRKWIVTNDLKYFMINLVYEEFWEDSNAQVRDSFMRAVCRGGTVYDYEQLLKKVLVHYNGANSFKFSQASSG